MYRESNLNSPPSYFNISPSHSYVTITWSRISLVFSSMWHCHDHRIRSWHLEHDFLISLLQVWTQVNHDPDGSLSYCNHCQNSLPSSICTVDEGGFDGEYDEWPGNLTCIDKLARSEHHGFIEFYFLEVRLIE